MKPITPEQVAEFKINKIPDFVYKAFNEMIQEFFNGTSSYFTQDMVIDRILSKTNSYNRQAIFANHFLDIESKYKEAGWNVKYSKEGRDGAYYKFNKK